MEQKFCQSCGMPMGETNEMYGTNTDGTKSADYCQYCFENGAFTSDVTMAEMIEICVPHTVDATDMTEAEARKMLKEHFPTLKRWQEN